MLCHYSAPRCKRPLLNSRVKAEQVPVCSSFVISCHALDLAKKSRRYMRELALKSAHIQIFTQHVVRDISHNKIQYLPFFIARKLPQSFVLPRHTTVHVPNNAGFWRNRIGRNNKVAMVNVHFRQHLGPIQHYHIFPRFHLPRIAVVNKRYAIYSLGNFYCKGLIQKK